MAADDTFGATFAPFPDPSGANTSRLPLQQAIQMLSLRMPRVVGAAAPAPAALLNAPSSAGRPDVHSAVLQTILQTIMGQGMPMADQPPPASPMGPMVPFAQPRTLPVPDPGGPRSSPIPQPRRDAPLPMPPSGPTAGPNVTYEPPSAPRDAGPDIYTGPDAPGSGGGVLPPDMRAGVPGADERRRQKQV